MTCFVHMRWLVLPTIRDGYKFSVRLQVIEVIFHALIFLFALGSGGSKGGRKGRMPPPGPNSSISCSFWEILAKSYVGAPPGSWRPLLGEILDQPLLGLNCVLLN